MALGDIIYCAWTSGNLVLAQAASWCHYRASLLISNLAAALLAFLITFKDVIRWSIDLAIVIINTRFLISNGTFVIKRRCLSQTFTINLVKIDFDCFDGRISGNCRIGLPQRDGFPRDATSFQ